MPLRLVVRVTHSQDGRTQDFAFDRFPVRIGRSPACELRLDYPFVSDQHAVFELHDGRVSLRDLGSTNGTLLRSKGRMGSGGVVDLAAEGNAFAIVALVFTCSTTDDGFPARSPATPGFPQATAAPPPSPGYPQPPPTTTVPGKAAFPPAIAPPPVVSNALSASLPAVPFPALTTSPGYGTSGGGTPAAIQASYAAYRQSWRLLFDSLQAGLEQHPPPARGPMLLDLVRRYPEIASELDLQHLAASLAVRLPNSTATASMAEAIALRGLTDLGRDLTGQSRGPEAPQELSTFLERLKVAMRTLLRATLAQREGVREVLESVRVEPDSALSRDRSTEAIALRLLEWSSPQDADASGAFEQDLTSLAGHHVAMFRAVMSGAKALLDELSPPTLERELEAEAARSGAGSTLGPFRYKTLWRVLERRHSDLANEERQVFGVLFGPKFAAAYESARATLRNNGPRSPRES